MQKTFNLASAKAFITTIDVVQDGYGTNYDKGVWGGCFNKTEQFDTFADVVKKYLGEEKINGFQQVAKTCSGPELSELFTKMEDSFPVLAMLHEMQTNDNWYDFNLNVKISIMNYICKLYLMETFLQNPNITLDQIKYANTLIEPDSYLKSIFNENFADKEMENIWEDVVINNPYQYSKKRKDLGDKYLRGNIGDFIYDLQLNLTKSLVEVHPKCAFHLASILPTNNIEWSKKSTLNSLILEKSVLQRKLNTQNRLLSNIEKLDAQRIEYDEKTAKIKSKLNEMQTLQSKLNEMQTLQSKLNEMQTLQSKLNETSEKMMQIANLINEDQQIVLNADKTPKQIYPFQDLSSEVIMQYVNQVIKWVNENNIKSTINSEITQLKLQSTAIDSTMKVEIQKAEDNIHAKKIAAQNAMIKEFEKDKQMLQQINEVHEEINKITKTIFSEDFMLIKLGKYLTELDREQDDKPALIAEIQKLKYTLNLDKVLSLKQSTLVKQQKSEQIMQRQERPKNNENLKWEVHMQKQQMLNIGIQPQECNDIGIQPQNVNQPKSTWVLSQNPEVPIVQEQEETKEQQPVQGQPALQHARTAGTLQWISSFFAGNKQDNQQQL